MRGFTYYLILSQPDIASRKAEKRNGIYSDHLDSCDREISETMRTKMLVLIVVRYLVGNLVLSPNLSDHHSC